MLPHVPWRQVTLKHRSAVTWTFPLERNEIASFSHEVLLDAAEIIWQREFGNNETGTFP